MIPSTKPIVRISDVDVVFGPDPEAALALIDAGKSRAEIEQATGQVLGVAGCTLDVYRGETIVLMGLSGSGKSTLLRAVNGLTPIARGEILVAMDDTLTSYVNPQSCRRRTLIKLRRQRVAMVFQQFGLLPWRSVRENVGFGLEMSGVSTRQRARIIDEQLDLVGLGDWADRRVGELSGGMQQRVGLARAFATEAPVLLMDEPFSALDPLIRDRLQDDLLSLQERLQRTIIFVSHDLDEALKIGNRIAIMNDGRIVQQGTARELIFAPATDYVAQFVARVNALSVWRARDIATLESLTKPASAVFLGADAIGKGVPVVVPAETPLKEVMKALAQTGRPVLVESNGAIIGSISMADVVAALAAR